MNIHLIANMYPSDAYPSYGVFVQNTEKILQDAGFTVTKTVMQKKTGKLQKLIQYGLYYATVLREGLSGKHDALYVHYAAHNAPPLLLLKKLKPNVKIVTNVHGSDVVPEVASQEKFQPYVKKLIRQSEMVLTPSNYYRDLVIEKYQPDTQIRIFPSGGVNKGVFYPAPEQDTAFRKELSLSETARYIGYVGRLDVGKGWEVFLKSIAHLKEHAPEAIEGVRFLVVGSGKDDEAYEQLVNELQLQDHIDRFKLMPQKDLVKVFNIIEAFIFPTKRKGESLGLVGLEAMACGTPIIASRIGGILDYTEEGKNGMLFDVGDHQALSSHIESFLQMPAKQQADMQQAALGTAAQYETSQISHLLVEAFEELQQNK
ncbi:glycosyltransferase family 4 protein [Jeotgalibacillus sp. JSM ZJ347]|uniref:glycosyltransferase family 4 protein n=1 Tax=Jeotgalibacillus sp. JSM ZJ347 TaxID=3342117 RepID=UPI0035A82024